MCPFPHFHAKKFVIETPIPTTIYQNMPALPQKVASTHLEEAKRVIKVTHGEDHDLFREAVQLAAKAALI